MSCFDGITWRTPARPTPVLTGQLRDDLRRDLALIAGGSLPGSDAPSTIALREWAHGWLLKI